MARSASNRLPWQDRWTQPTVEQLLHPIEEQRRKIVQALLEGIQGYEGVQTQIIWYGPSWKWTLHFTLHNDAGEEIETLAYLVPAPTAPILCIPLRDEMIEKLPLRRLSKYVREGIRLAKCAVEVHWAVWTPSQNPEVEQLMDLIKRKHKMLRAADAEAAE